MAVLGLMADPGLPERLARQLEATIREDIGWVTGDRESSEPSWEVQVSRQTLPLDTNGRIALMERAEGLRATHGWDLVVYLTDLPRTHDHRTLVTEWDATCRGALISLPAFGGFRIRHKLRTELLRVIAELAGPQVAADHDGDPNRAGRSAGDGSASGEAHGPGDPQAGPETNYRTIAGRWGRWRLLGGMVRSNRPGRLVGSLSSAAAAAMATGAFGIFYASIWNMADSSSALRLLLVSVLAVLTLTGWLIVHNGLWSTHQTEVDRTPAALDNTATVVTVFLSVMVMYAGLYLAVLLGSLAIISGGYLRSQLGHPVSLADYANLSWLSASLGIFAGALGSNFDGDAAVRDATYSRRERERRELAEQDESNS
ncbi:hypothetical protein FJV46_08630 [Arthrobacter agilis]|uniref:hypothetical protein n=1 Tax=Arthrobacter agilis TaxID=37921 RepID=UPI000B35A310|nr:hypothetical protein [Arthrobacter agilis]OUM43188.1 hypothetical protein B8W74_08155 [Arthrobacter agilis]PPB47670.1 hypothetical protein CI784_00655 [Arthrobacter agilis]TPV25672.1 hypothetical protein FJV46_08630 [Arthrobacter agilis]VDR33454.1 Uncharacterised protein [Arthrobacter agilis]